MRSTTIWPTGANQKNEESEEIRRLIRKYNEQEYIHWDDLQRKNLPYDPVAFWFVIRTIRSTKYPEIQIGDEKFPFCTPEKFQKQLHRIDKASPGSFDWLFGEFPSEANKQQYLVNSLMEEAIASSQLEGAATTRMAAKKILREKRKPKNTSERMIVNNYQTISGSRSCGISRCPVNLSLKSTVRLPRGRWRAGVTRRISARPMILLSAVKLTRRRSTITPQKWQRSRR